MPWKYILNIRLNEEIVYKRDSEENYIYISDKSKSSLDKINCNGEILYNMEVNDNARQHS